MGSNSNRPVRGSQVHIPSGFFPKKGEKMVLPLDQRFNFSFSQRTTKDFAWASPFVVFHIIRGPKPRFFLDEVIRFRLIQPPQARGPSLLTFHPFFPGIFRIIPSLVRPFDSSKFGSIPQRGSARAPGDDRPKRRKSPPLGKGGLTGLCFNERIHTRDFFGSPF